MYLNTHDNRLWWLQRVLQYIYEGQDPDKIKLKVSQDITSPGELAAKRNVQSILKPIPVNHGLSKTLEGLL